ncbi:MAG: glutamate synthase-related protein, partial [Pseudomonadota bacterium]
MVFDSGHKGGCGIVGIADLSSPASHELIRSTIQGISRMEHRGGTLNGTGDGAGLLIRYEKDFFAPYLQNNRQLADTDEDLIVGTIWFNHDLCMSEETLLNSLQKKVDSLLMRHGLMPLGWRQVLIDPSALGPAARLKAPMVYHLLAGRGHRSETHLHAILFAIKNQLEEQLSTYLSIPSLDSSTLVYKVLGTAEQLDRFYPDLRDPRLKSRLALGHRRFATNSTPNWDLVQPFRLLAHNGEFNTITANRRAFRDAEYAMGANCRLMPEGSDTCDFDRVVEMMTVNGMSGIAEALRRLMTPAWHDQVCSDLEQRFFDANRRAMGTLGSWEGPAAILASDGNLLVGLLDRMGLRPLRYALTKEKRLIVASEMGAVPIDPRSIESDGQLEPGEMIIADLSEGKFLTGQVANSWVISKSRLNFDNLATENLLKLSDAAFDRVISNQALNRFGWTRERVGAIQETTRKASSPVIGMGNDFPLAIFSENHSRLYSFLHQIVAVVTNPPIDSLREGSAMDLTIYLGSSPRVTKLSTYESRPQYRLAHPVLTNEQIEALLSAEEEPFARRIDATFNDGGTGRSLVERIHACAQEALDALREGISILILSDLAALNSTRLPLPMLLVVGEIHKSLAAIGHRRDVSLVVETAEVHEAHDLAVLLAYGATAVNPYAILHLARQVQNMDCKLAQENLLKALVETFRKIMSKMGITSLSGYRGSALFEAVGLSPQVVEFFIPDTVSKVGGLSIDDIYQDIVARSLQGETEALSRNKNKSIYRSEVIDALQNVAKYGNEKGDYDSFKKLVSQTPLIYLRDLLDLDRPAISTPLDEVMSVEKIIQSTVRGAAMSHGAIHGIAHRAIAAAFNSFGSMSNSGEGGEEERRNPGGPWSGDRSRIRQIASGRFGVDAAYLAGADEIEIKIGQGAKPGEGGHLPSHKVTEEIAAIRKVRPWVTLISPPPHHDIYSIEDLKQLIINLKELHPNAEVSVKIPSISRIGAIVMGILKAGADVITISGFEGGTGAAEAGSIAHAGLPLDLGLSEAHQILVQNGVRDRLRLRADGGIKTALDVAKLLR